MAFNTDPRLWLSIGQGLTSGSTVGGQIGGLAQSLNGYQDYQAQQQAASQQQQAALQAKQLAAQQKNQTLQLLMKTNPELAQAVQSGALTPNDAFMMDYKQRQEARNPKTLPPTDIERKLMAAGIDPRSEEGRKIILRSIAPKNTTLSVGTEGTVQFTDGVNEDGAPKLNVEQGKNTGFLIRAESADKVISDFESEGTSMWNKAASALPLGAGNYFVSQDTQKLNQAKRDFINAVLRQESGAVIGEQEFANAEQQYFPQPGDGPEVIKQKADNRKNAIAGFRIRSGPGADVVDQRKQPSQSALPDVTKMSDAELEALANGQ